ncbi:MAG: carbohydrate-binding family 9-like protein [Acidobacteria bacterium]|nr:carbohydrate-binding family 9-like protein [Acidobacteriota bacterium]
MAASASYTIARAARPPVPESLWSSPDWRAVTPAPLAHFHPRSSLHRPRTDVKVLHSDEGLHVHFSVADRYVRVAHVGFQAPVYKDSCAEFFVRPGGTGGYLNFEMNAGGSLLASFIEDWTRTPEGFRRARPLEPEWDTRISRVHALPERIDPEITRPVDWSVQYMIPWSLIADVVGHGRPAPGDRWTGNFYKCGDETSHPHWAAWSPIGGELNFHAPERFGLLVFA